MNKNFVRESGIRTHGSVSPSSFQDYYLRPLGHLSRNIAKGVSRTRNPTGYKAEIITIRPPWQKKIASGNKSDGIKDYWKLDTLMLALAKCWLNYRLGLELGVSRYLPLPVGYILSHLNKTCQAILSFSRIFQLRFG